MGGRAGNATGHSEHHGQTGEYFDPARGIADARFWAIAGMHWINSTILCSFVNLTFMGLNAEIPYRSTPQTDVQPGSNALRKFLLPKNSPQYFAAYGFDVDFECVLNGVFPPAAQNTPASAAVFNGKAAYGMVNPNAILTDFTQPSDSGAGIGKFKGTFNIVPASWSDFKTMSFVYPGWLGIIGSSTARDVRTYKVNTRLLYDYFVIDPANLAAGVVDSSGTLINVVASMGAIPSLYKNYFFATLGGVTQFNLYTNSLVPVGGVTIGSSVYPQTMPPTVAYQGWISNVQKTDGTGGWNTAAWNGKDLTQANVGQFVADDSFLEVHAGNIIARVTPYVLAK